jgi:O-antigen ligase
LILAFGAAGILFSLASPVIRERLHDVLSVHDDPRVRLWQTALRIWWDHPVFGAGLGSYKTQFPIYKVPGDYMATGHPHNDLLNILVHSGILGVAAFAFIGIRYGRMIRRSLSAARRGDPRRSLLLAGVVVPLAFLAGGLGQCFLTDEEVGTLFWFLIAGFTAVARARSEERDALP